MSETARAMHIYEVGIASSVRKVEAPSAKAAALFYGVFGTVGNAQLAAVVYTEDGVELQGCCPWGEYQFAVNKDDELIARLEAELEAIHPDVDRCHFVDEGAES